MTEKILYQTAVHLPNSFNLQNFWSVAELMLMSPDGLQMS